MTCYLKLDFSDEFTDNKDMGSQDNFSAQLLQALDAKSTWFDTVALPKVLENYRLHSSCVQNLLSALIKKSIIQADPYKHDKKISNIIIPENTEFSEGERSSVIGLRLSDYDSMLDFLCNYFKFSVSHVDLNRINKLLALNNTFLWDSFTINNPKPNTRGLATLMAQARNGADPLTISLFNDTVSKSARAIAEINATLGELYIFQKEMYKGQVRKNVFEHPGFNKEAAYKSESAMLEQIKKLLPAVLGKKSYNADLVKEILEEEFGSQKEARRAEVLRKLEVKVERKVKKVQKVDTKEMILDAIHLLGALTPQITAVAEKVVFNHNVLEGQKNSFFDKLKAVFRKAFNLTEPPVIYEVIEVDKNTGNRRKVTINYHDFISNLNRRLRVYNSFSVKNSPGYQRVAGIEESKILDFVQKQSSECNSLFIQLNALDEFFKSACTPSNKSKIKGMKMDLAAMKNTLVNVNQHKAEYCAYIEEQTQMRKLGITDEE